MDRETRWLRSRLPKKALDYLDDNERHLNGAWSTLLAIARYCHTAGMVFEEFRHLVNESDFSGSTSLLARGRESKIRKTWDSVQEATDTPADRDGIRNEVLKLKTRALARPWPGRGGITDRQMATAILNRCHELGTYSPVLSARFLAERTSRGAATASRSLTRLEKLGLIARQGVTTEGNTRYRINLRWEAKGHNETSSLVPSTCTSVSLQIGSVPQHDAFTSKALGPEAGRIWFSLSGSMTAAEAAAEYGLSAKTARRYLDSLVSVGLAVKSEGRPAEYKAVTVSVERLDEIAAEYGALGWHDRQRDNHQSHREAQRIARESRERDRAPGIFTQKQERSR